MTRQSNRPEKSTVQLAPPSPLRQLQHVIYGLGGDLEIVIETVIVRVPPEHEEAMNAAVDAYEAAIS
jgi:hypothetical protein